MDRESAPLALLTEASSAFHAKVLAARLAAEGIAVEFRGMNENPYPLPGTVDVFVHLVDLDSAREILLADEVDAAFLPVSEERDRPSRAAWWPFRRGREAR